MLEETSFETTASNSELCDLFQFTENLYYRIVLQVLYTAHTFLHLVYYQFYSYYFSNFLISSCSSVECFETCTSLIK